MSYQENFELWKQAIENLPLDQTLLPDQTIDGFVNHAETLAVEAAKDSDALAKAGMDTTIISDLPTLSGALRHLQAIWMSEYRTNKEVQKEWKEQSPAAYALRDELLHHFSFAYRNDSNLTQKVKRIKEGSDHADMVQDLVELAVLGESYPEPLQQINLETSVLEKAKTVSKTMANLLAQVNGIEKGNDEKKINRDKAFTLLRERVNTICEYGQYVFWKNPDRKEKYLKR